jgi:hypothetical protein
MDTNRMHHHPTAVEVGEDALEVTGGLLRAVEIGAAVLLGLLITPPLAILAAVVAIPAIAFAALAGAVAAAILGPVVLVRHVRAHHRRHGTTMFAHRLLPHAR